MTKSDEPNLDPYYENLHNYVKMVTGGYTRLLMLDAKGGLGKTHNVRMVLDDELPNRQWIHRKGFTTPIELYKTLWQARNEGTVLFLDDMSGVTNNQKAVDMLKAATDTEGDENWVEYHTSRDIDNPNVEGRALPNTFCFRGRIIMSFNDTPDNHHFDALRDRGIDYHLSFSYHDRLDIIREVAKIGGFSDLTIPDQKETAEWIAEVTDSSFDVTIRTFEEICSMRSFAKADPSANWEKMAYELFNLNWKKHLIIQMREADEMSVGEQVDEWCKETGKSESHYYDLLAEIRDARAD